MLRIAVCDDAPGDLENLVALVKRYQTAKAWWADRSLLRW